MKPALKFDDIVAARKKMEAEQAGSGVVAVPAKVVPKNGTRHIEPVQSVTPETFGKQGLLNFFGTLALGLIVGAAVVSLMGPLVVAVLVGFVATIYIVMRRMLR